MEIKSKYRTSMVNGDIILEIEADYKEAIEALCFLMNGVESLPPLTAIAGSLKSEWIVCQRVVEKAYGEKWENIRREK